MCECEGGSLWWWTAVLSLCYVLSLSLFHRLFLFCFLKNKMPRGTFLLVMSHDIARLNHGSGIPIQKSECVVAAV